ncbi:MAG: hypothetical protein OXI79_20370 [Gammaproteobacteria bacterium]|nr:hypothetical protein [Gammaproteobacteria bacterium]
MTQRAGILTARIEGQNPIQRLAKDYARQDRTTGVPLDELAHLIGSYSVMEAGTSVGTTANGWRFTDARVAMQPVTHTWSDTLIGDTDGIRIELTRRYVGAAAGRPSDTWTFEVLADEWRQLAAGAVGDVLGTQDPDTGEWSPNDKGLLAEGTDGENGRGAIFVGRTADNQVLIHPHLFVVQLFLESLVDARIEFGVFSGGVLGSRINGLRSYQPERRIGYKIASAGKPADPDAGTIGYDGAAVTGIPTGGVPLSHADPALSGQEKLWYLTTAASYDQTFRSWSVPGTEWVVVEAGGGGAAFDIQFAPTAEPDASWEGGAAQSDDFYARVRKPDGSWSVFPIREAPRREREWTLLAEASVSPLAATFRHIRLDPVIDLRELQWLVVEFSYHSMETYRVLLPAGVVPSHYFDSSAGRSAVPMNPGENLVFGVGPRGGYHRWDDAATDQLDDAKRFLVRFEHATNHSYSPRLIEYLTMAYGANQEGTIRLRGL